MTAPRAFDPYGVPKLQRRYSPGSVGANTSNPFDCSDESEHGAVDADDLVDAAHAIMRRALHSAAKCCLNNAAHVLVHT